MCVCLQQYMLTPHTCMCTVLTVAMVDQCSGGAAPLPMHWSRTSCALTNEMHSMITSIAWLLLHSMNLLIFNLFICIHNSYLHTQYMYYYEVIQGKKYPQNKKENRKQLFISISYTNFLIWCLHSFLPF